MSMGTQAASFGALLFSWSEGNLYAVRVSRLVVRGGRAFSREQPTSFQASSMKVAEIIT